MSRPTPARDRLNRILTAPQTPLERVQREYLRSLILRNCSERTIEYWSMNLVKFNLWCDARSIAEVDEITLEILNAYRQHLFHYRNPQSGKRLKFSTQHCYLIVIRRWFHWMHEKGQIKENIAADLEIPKTEERLPVDVLSADEVESMMNQTDVSKPMGIRDRALMETFYSTAIRASELSHLQLYDLDVDRKILVVRLGKGKKDRVVPIGDRAIQWIQKYVADVRPAWMTTNDPHPYLFVTRHGGAAGGCAGSDPFFVFFLADWAPGSVPDPVSQMLNLSLELHRLLHGCFCTARQTANPVRVRQPSGYFSATPFAVFCAKLATSTPKWSAVSSRTTESNTP